DPKRKVLGLYLDEAEGDKIRLTGPPGDDATRPAPPPKHPAALFQPGAASLYQEVLARLPDDGLDTSVYGYPSGVVGLRLMPNPDFFGNTPAAAWARQYWHQRVVAPGNDAFYTDNAIQADPALVRPFRVSMACAFCHVGPHPLSPPEDPEHPAWANLSSTIGNQYWSPPRVFANLTPESSFLHHFLASQQPGTIDTSLVSTDHINNANTINAIFDVPARLARAGGNRPERQSLPNLLLPGVEDALPSTNPRHTPRVLLDGADSIGVFGALARVYLNIGTFPEEWGRCHNPVIGFKPQRPFAVSTLRANSVYWRASEKYRIPYLAAFFTHPSGKDGRSITAPMKLRDAPGGAAAIDEAKAALGREVFLDNCALCHSSKQPAGFELAFSDEWAKARVPGPADPAAFTLPKRFEDWEAFRAGAAFHEYGRRIREEAARPGEDFFKDNFLSNEVRIPITLVGTNSGRAVATNGMKGQVWDNFSSDDYKALPAVGAVRFYNPYRGGGVDAWGNNDSYEPPPGGPGYYRPASLVSLWATAPYLHNNALGLYNSDPSVAGRLHAFDDGIGKLLNRELRHKGSQLPGDLRTGKAGAAGLAAHDPGFIYRTPNATSIGFARPFIRPLLSGILGGFWTSFLTLYLWILLALLAVVLAVWGQPRHAGFALFVIALLSGALVVLTRLDRLWWAVWLVPALATAAALCFWLGWAGGRASRILFAVLAATLLVIGFGAHRFVQGRWKGLRLGPIPAGTPVNLIMNMNPEAPPGDLLRAGAALVRGMLLVRTGRRLDEAAALRAFENE
ncbi:MAG TPA: hypothetical protein VF310_14990, partial [Vicinamibacteria bacterium]